MRLKIATTATLILGVILLFAWPFILGPRPASNAPRKVLAIYAERGLLYFFVVCMVFLATAFLAWLVARQVRIEYLQGLRKNVEVLMEGSLRDHAKEEHE